MERIRLEIAGMSCGHCVTAVRTELAKLQGVQVEQVAVGSATVSLDPAKTSANQLVDAVAEAGYSARLAAA